MEPMDFRGRLRSRLGALVVDNLFRGLSSVGRLHPQARPWRHNAELVPNLRYRDGEHPAPLLDVYRQAAPRAVIPACGILQVSDSARFARRRKLPALLVDRLLEVEEAYLAPSQAAAGERELADPLVVLERGAAPERPLPSFFVPVGTAD